MTATNVDHIRVYCDSAGEFRWAGIADNGEIVAEGEGHTRHADAVRAAHGALGAEIPIRDEEPSS